MLINLFSNRSFRDVFQYPIFRTLFNIVKKKRNMGAHIGFQEIDRDTMKRRDYFLSFIVGNNITSLIDSCSQNSIINLSIPYPIPPAGGIPYSNASTKS